MSPLLRRLGLGLGLAAAFFAVAEAALALLGLPDPGLYAGDLATVWTLRPDLPPREVPFPERGTRFTVRTSHAGYRGGPPAAGATVCLGDSTTFGWGVEEDEAWPAALAARLGQPTVNAGVPGHSTHQGRATLPAALALAPRRVVFAYLVRDADRAAVPDAARAPAPALPSWRLVRLVRGLRPAPPAPGGPTYRVPPEAYRANLEAMVAAARAAGAEAVVLAFPMRQPPAAHLAALDGLAGVPVLRPVLAPDAFFAEDPIHLTPAGHAALAEAVAAALLPGGAP